MVTKRKVGGYRDREALATATRAHRVLVDLLAGVLARGDRLPAGVLLSLARMGGLLAEVGGALSDMQAIRNGADISCSNGETD